MNNSTDFICRFVIYHLKIFERGRQHMRFNGLGYLDLCTMQSIEPNDHQHHNLLTL